jgi:hypothetical protein
MGIKNSSITQLRKHCLTFAKPVIGLAINWIRMGGWVAYSKGEPLSMGYSAWVTGKYINQ